VARFTQVHPVIAVSDVVESIKWYCGRLEFEILFVEPGDVPGYAGLGRDGVEIHLQSHSAEEWHDGLTGAAYRFLVDDLDELYDEFNRLGAIPDGKGVEQTTWGTYDPSGNALFFYRDQV